MVNVTAFLLVIITWLTINAIWVELSLYTSRLPEGWSLPSYLSLIIQAACLLTLIYSVGHRYTRFNSNKAPLILSLLILAQFVCFYWHFFGKKPFGCLILNILLLLFLLLFVWLWFALPPIFSLCPIWLIFTILI
uniref:Riboflavin transporter n=1 Tax=Meloidogyne enterolobii TaxID=390850 RepID=A0A6V7YD06_MELEN|nr:unnamed protein product [Meloidogyne enterolobii]